MVSPSEILRKPKQAKADKKDGDKDDKGKTSKRNALVDFIAKCKKG